MDFWSRLLSGAGNSSADRQTNFNSPQQRLIRFKKVHEQLQQIWRRNSAITSTKNPVAPEPVFHCLQSLKTILQGEVHTPTPHLCARDVSTFQIHMTLTHVASTYYDEKIIHETLDIFKILLESEEGDFLRNKSFADALIGFISTIATTGPLMVNVDTEARMVEVLFGIAAKLRLEPDLLKTWFRPSSKTLDDNVGGLEDGPKRISEKDDFPLFYMTLDYVHHDGKTGDFARTGLLYLIESAAYSVSLEQWMIESDLATLMASGLGALYSQLSRKLVLSFEKESVPLIMSLSETPRPPTPPDAEKTTSPDFKGHLATFLAYLIFWQDVLEHCSSNDVKQSLLDHFKYLFLQQLLYPSLIESSDKDSGSSVAVLTYLRCIIESVDHPDLVRLIFQYLLAVPEAHDNEVSTSRPTTLARRRKSQTLISNLTQGQEKPVPDLFNLVDLVHTSLRSRNQQTVTATLRLVSVVLRNHDKYDMSLVKTQKPKDGRSTRTLGAHNGDTSILFSLAEDLTDHERLRESYDAHLQDAQTLLESHHCTSCILTLPDAELVVDRAKSAQPHLIASEDPLLGSLVSLLRVFFANDVATNLDLTQAFSTLASCGSTRLEFWLLGSPVESEMAFDGDVLLEGAVDEPDHDNAITNDNFAENKSNGNGVTSPIATQSPSVRPLSIDGSSSPVFAALNSLVQQVESFRQDIQNFDTYLSERRHVFSVGEEIESAVADDYPPSRRSEDSTSTAPPKSRNVAQIGSISERLLSENSTAHGSRANSPLRGRQPEITATPKLIGRLNHLRISPSPNPAKAAPRAFSPSPLRNDSIASTPPRQAITPMGPADALRQIIKVRINIDNAGNNGREDIASETSSIRSGSTVPEPTNGEQFKEVNLSHLLTNVIILQEFILELAAIVQVRASLFGEVEFT